MSVIISARCNIYISRLSYDASVRLSVRLSVTFVHCGHRVQWIPDIFCMLGWMDVFATYWQYLTWIVGWDDARISGGRGGGVEKLVIVEIVIYLLRVWNHVTFLLLFTYGRC